MKRLRFVLAVWMTLVVVLCAGCSMVSSRTKSTESDQSSTVSSQAESTESDRSSVTSTQNYEDERWPTTNTQLLAIPESQRWYNASSQVGTRCTVAGPVVSVTYASSSAGKPVFVNIGAAYPSKESVQLVIWTDGDWSAFSSMLTDLDQNESCWLSVTGYLQSYNGYMQFNSSDGCEFTWWTNVS